MAIVLEAKEQDIGGLMVRRALPHQKCCMVGPFIFLDFMGPTEFNAGEGIEVLPHPHIGLSTLTYLLKGSILHRDSLGNKVEITPGDVNWMTAGKGIVHSERETIETRSSQHSIHGLQSWIALPESHSEIEPTFQHVKKSQLPETVKNGVIIRLIVGDAYGLSSPIKTYWPMFYVDVVAPTGTSVQIPSIDHETAIYPIYGEVVVGEKSFHAEELILLEPEENQIKIESNSRFIMLGGKAFDTVPFIHWNYVSFSKERIDKAKEQWANQAFPHIPDDNREFVPHK